MNIRPAIFLVENGCLLLMKYQYSEIVYNLPGGNVEAGETLSQTLVREMQEELNLRVEVGQLLLVAETFHEGKNKAVLHCIFSGRRLAGEPVLNPEHTTSIGVEWLPLEKLSEVNLYPSVFSFIKNLVIDNQNFNFYAGRIIQQWF